MFFIKICFVILFSALETAACASGFSGIAVIAPHQQRSPCYYYR
jgi:hypothetical protein